MADFSKPTVGSAYTSFPTEITDAVTAALQQLSVLPNNHSNIPNGAIQFSLTDNRWKKFNNGSFVDLTSTYAFNAQISATQVSVGDGQKILLGNSNDFEIVHDGANSVIRETGDGSLFIQSDDIVRLGKTDGTNNYLEASLAQIILKSGNSEKIKIDSSGAILPDNANIRFGADADLRLFYDGTNSSIDNHTNNLNIRSLGINGTNIQIIAESDFMARFVKNGAVELYFDNNKKIETLTNGAKITGALNVNSTSLDSHQAVIEGGVAGQSTSSLALKTGSGANSKVTDLSFYSTFVTPTSDQGQRRSADITSGFSTGAWGNEYIAFHIGKGSSTGNDNQALTDERVRMNKYGIRVAGTSNNSTTDSWDTNSAITTSGSFGGGIAMIDGSAGFVQSLDGLGSNYYLRSATTTSTPETNIKAVANGAVELYFDANKKVETKSYGFLAENADTNILVHNPNNSRGGLAALSTQRLALATTTGGDNIVFGFGSAEPVTSSNFTERLRIDNFTGNIKIPNDNAQLQIGADVDLVLVHDGNNSIIDEVGTGVLAIRSDTGINILKRTGDEPMIKAIPDGSVELYYDNVRMTQTTAKGFKITGNSSNPTNTGWETDSALVLDGAFAGGLAFKDGSFGGATMFVHVAGAQWALRMAASGGTPENAITADRNGSVHLYYDGSEKIKTDPNGVIVTGGIFTNSGTNNQVHINPSDGSIEISRAAGGAFIDFKNDLGEDNDARIQEASGGFTMTGNVAATSFSGSGAALTNLPVPVHTVKHVRQTSDFEIATGNTSYGVAGNINMTITAPSSGTFLLFYNYSLNILQGGSVPNGNTARVRGKVNINGQFSHFWLPQAEGNGVVGTKTAIFSSEGVNGSTYYSANDSINIVLEIRNGDTGTGLKSRLGAGSYLTVFLVKLS